MRVTYKENKAGVNRVLSAIQKGFKMAMETHHDHVAKALTSANTAYKEYYYERINKRVPSSQPNKAPNKHTGFLASHLSGVIKKGNKLEFTYSIVNTARYAYDVEMGHTIKSEETFIIAPRPFMRPHFNEVRHNAINNTRYFMKGI